MKEVFNKLSLSKILFAYVITLLSILTCSMLVIASKFEVSGTIVVDASTYLQQELEESNRVIMHLDTKYEQLFKDLEQSNEKITQLKENINNRQNNIYKLKQKLNNHEQAKTDTSIATFSDMQHDSIFSNFLEEIHTKIPIDGG